MLVLTVLMVKGGRDEFGREIGRDGVVLGGE